MRGGEGGSSCITFARASYFLDSCLIYAACFPRGPIVNVGVEHKGIEGPSEDEDTGFGAA